MSEEQNLSTKEIENKENNNKYLEYRKSRVKRIKRFLIIALIISILIPNVLCIYLLIRVNSLQNMLDSLSEQLNYIEELKKANLEAMNKADEQKLVEEIEEEEVIVSDEILYPGKKLVYLTFDDGPSKFTDDILDILKQYDVKATFFVLAKEGYDSQYQRMIDEGHVLAIHSYTHQYKTIYESVSAYRTDVTDMKDFLSSRYGYDARFYRFPGGSSNQVSQVDKNELFKVLDDENLCYVDWNVSSQDASAKKLSAESIYQNVIKGVESHNSSVVLMHDAADKSTTVEALSMIIEKLLEDGNVEILPISEGTDFARHVLPSEKE